MDQSKVASPLNIENKGRSEKLLDISRYSAIFGATVGPFSTALMSLCCVLMIFTWVASGEAFSLSKNVMSQAVAKSLALFFLVVVVGVFYSAVDIKTAVNTVWSWRKLAYIFILLGIFNSLYWKDRFINFFLMGMTLALFLSYLAWFEIIPSRDSLFLGILAKNYTQQSMAFVIATICLIVRIKDAPKQHQYAYLALIVLFVINILYVSESRTGYISLVSGAFVALLYILGKKKAPYIVLGIITLVAIAGISSQNLQNRVKLGLDEIASYQTSPSITSIGIRVVFAENTIEMVKKKPLLGYGTGSFEAAYTEQVANKYSDWRAEPTTDPHNQYLFVLTEHGVIGLLIFIGFILTVIRTGLITDKYGAIAASVMCAWVFASLFNSTFKTFIEGHLLGLLLGTMLAAIPTSTSVKS